MTGLRTRLTLAAALASVALAPARAARGLESEARARSARIVVLSTMLADAGIGEWGFAALVEVDGKRLLFDTGARPETVLQNARELRVDLASVRDVILSHGHSDHTGGLMTLRRALSKSDPAALSRAHVGKGIFATRVGASGEEDDSTARLRREFEAAGGSFVEYDAPREIAPGVWLTGPVPRIHPERNWSGARRVRTPEGLVEDTVPEDQSLVVDTERGLVILSMLSGINAYHLMATRTLFAMSRDGLFARFGESVNEGGTPAPALLISTIVAVTFLLTGTFEQVSAKAQIA